MSDSEDNVDPELELDEELGDIIDDELTRVMEEYYVNLNVSCFYKIIISKV